MMNLTLSCTTLWKKRANKLGLLLLLAMCTEYAASQFSISVDLGRTHYTSNGALSRFNYQNGNGNGREFLQIYQNNLFMGSANLQYKRKQNSLTVGVERNSISFNKQRFDRNGQLTRSFWFSVLSVGVGRSWLLTPPEAAKIELNLNVYGFAILNKTGVEKNSQFYFSPSTYQSNLDDKRESFSISSGNMVGLGLNGKLMIFPKFKNPNISLFAKADVSVTSFFSFIWYWQEDGYPHPSADRLDSHRKSFTLGMAYMLTKAKKTQ